MSSFPHPIPLCWEANMWAPHSFAIVTHETVRALRRRPEVDLTLFPIGTNLLDPDTSPVCRELMPLTARSKGSPIGRDGPRPVFVRLQFPLTPLPPPRTEWVVYHPWEYSLSARPSVAVMKRAREVWTTSQFSLEAFVRSGVSREKIHVLHHGIDPDIFHPRGLAAKLPTAKPFRFLFVGGTIFRKGVDILIEAYGRAFTAADPVSLVIKDYGAAQIYHYEKGRELIAEFARDPHRPEVLHLPEYRTNQEMAGLYRACDVFVSSYRGEGFCMPALEAMACGLPAIVTAGGSTDDFVSEAEGWRIPAVQRTFSSTLFEMPVDGEAQLFDPDVDALAELLRRAYRDEAARRTRGEAAARLAATWTWDAAAGKIVQRCQAIHGTPALT